jgi:S-adenosylmethionine:tRNA ribosyltransferase-isomerase
VKTADFDFALPPERIAQEPARPRDSARLLRVDGDTLGDFIVRDLPDLLRPGDLLVFNDTRVIPAQLDATRGQARIGITLHKALRDGDWMAFAKNAKRLKEGDTLAFGEGVEAAVIARDGGEVRLRFRVAGGSLDAALEKIGRMPLPPYIQRSGDLAEDRRDYQTMFARAAGAVAAPTAGLHFTPELIARLQAKGIGHATVTLHVGAGTFLPVTADNTDEHRMHAETGAIGPEAAMTINETRARGGRIVAVGSTSMRLMESAADESGQVRPFHGETAIFITPGYRFRVADLMLTNFHLPRSTLFMLVAAFAGLDRMKRAYAHAIAQDYRFYSYGDACLLSKAP